MDIYIDPTVPESIEFAQKTSEKLQLELFRKTLISAEHIQNLNIRGENNNSNLRNEFLFTKKKRYFKSIDFK